MPMIALANLEPGMVLADAVHDRNGRLLLGEGVEIEAKHLLIFRTWGIAEAAVVGEDGSDTSVLPDTVTVEKLEQARSRLLPLYCHTDLEHPAVCELLRLAVIREVQYDQ